MTAEMTTVLAIIAVMGNLITIWKFISWIKEKAVEEGERQKTIKQLEKDLGHAYEKIRSLENSVNQTEKVIIEIRGDIKHILKTVEDLKNAFNSKNGGCI